MGACRRDCARLAIVVVLGPGRGREERLVVHEVGFAVEQIVHAAGVSLEERPRVIQEGQIDALGFFPPLFIVQGHPIVLRGFRFGWGLVAGNLFQGAIKGLLDTGVRGKPPGAMCNSIEEGNNACSRRSYTH